MSAEATQSDASVPQNQQTVGDLLQRDPNLHSNSAPLQWTEKQSIIIRQAQRNMNMTVSEFSEPRNVSESYVRDVLSRVWP